MEIGLIPTNDFQLLSALDKKIFNADDAFDPEDFSEYSCFLVQANGVSIGSVVLGEHFTIGASFDGEETAELGILYIASTGLIPQYQGRGIGKMVKAWEVGYARGKGFRKIITNVRLGSQPIIKLNNKFGFVATRIIPNYYADGTESLVMELAL